MAVLYNVLLKVASREAIKTFLESKTGPLHFDILNGDDETLAIINLESPVCCSIDPETGALTFIIASAVSGIKKGTAVTGVLRDSASPQVVWLSAPCKQGATAESGYFVLSYLEVSVGAPVELISAAIV